MNPNHPIGENNAYSTLYIILTFYMMINTPLDSNTNLIILLWQLNIINCSLASTRISTSRFLTTCTSCTRCRSVGCHERIWSSCCCLPKILAGNPQSLSSTASSPPLSLLFTPLLPIVTSPPPPYAQGTPSTFCSTHTMAWRVTFSDDLATC